MCWGKAKKQTEQKQPQGQKTPGRVFYWTGNNPNLLCNFLVTEDEEDYFGYQRLNYEVVDRTDVEEISLPFSLISRICLMPSRVFTVGWTTSRNYKALTVCNITVMCLCRKKLQGCSMGNIRKHSLCFWQNGANTPEALSNERQHCTMRGYLLT